jgi:hypothetical protein
MTILSWCYSQQQRALHLLLLHDLRLLALLVIHHVALQDSVCLRQPSVMVDLTVRISQMKLIVVSSVNIVLEHFRLFFLWFLICSCCFVVFFFFSMFRIPWLCLISYSLLYCNHSDCGTDVHSAVLRLWLFLNSLSAFLSFICSLPAISLAAEQWAQPFFTLYCYFAA